MILLKCGKSPLLISLHIYIDLPPYPVKNLGKDKLKKEDTGDYDFGCGPLATLYYKLIKIVLFYHNFC